MTITNMRAFSNKVKKQFNMNYGMHASEVSTYMVDYLADTIEFIQGDHATLTDHIYNMFPAEHGVTKARNVASNLLS